LHPALLTQTVEGVFRDFVVFEITQILRPSKRRLEGDAALQATLRFGAHAMILVAGAVIGDVDGGILGERARLLLVGTVIHHRLVDTSLGAYSCPCS